MVCHGLIEKKSLQFVTGFSVSIPYQNLSLTLTFGKSIVLLSLNRESTTAGQIDMAQIVVTSLPNS